jgi:Spy/CpxP family protein refolding chaperone
MKKWYVLLMFVLALALVTTLFAFGPRFGNGGPPDAGPDPCGSFGPGMFGAGPERPGGFRDGPGPAFREGMGPARYLNLSKEQLDKMRAMVDRSFQETRDVRYEVLQKGVEMHKLFTDPKIDEATLLAKQKELNSLHQKLMDKMAQTVIEGRKILTPEQIQKLDRMPMGHGHRGFGMMGPNLLGPP